MRKLLPSFLLVMMLALVSLNAGAKVYDPIPGNDDVIHLATYDVDLAAKIHMIYHATKTIDVSSFSIGHDQYGEAVVRALRVALQRGVRVRIIFESIISRFLGNDIFLLTENLLLDPSLARQAEIIDMGAGAKFWNGMTLNDFIHQKVMVFDAGTENESVYFGGRDFFEFIATTLDSGFLVRPLDFHKPYLGTAIAAEFESTWNILTSNYELKSPSSEFVANYAILNSVEAFPDLNSQIQNGPLYREVLHLIMKKPVKGEALSDIQFRPVSTQIVTNDLLARVASKRVNSHLSLQPELLGSDEIVMTLAGMLSRAKDIRVMSYSSDYVPQFLNSLVYTLNRGANVRVYTDGENALNNVDQANGLLSRITRTSLLSFFNSMIAMKSVLARIEHPESLTVFGVDLAKLEAASRNKMDFLHRKMMLLDQDILVTGSHNFTTSSATKNDEIVVIFKDPRMNYYFRKVTADEERSLFTQVDPRDPRITEEIGDHKIREFLFNEISKGLY